MTTPHLTCLLTGATNGIGQAGATQLAEKGYTLFLTARSEHKAAQTERLIKARVPQALKSAGVAKDWMLYRAPVVQA